MEEEEKKLKEGREGEKLCNRLYYRGNEWKSKVQLEL